jgi:hypothetical protein
MTGFYGLADKKGRQQHGGLLLLHSGVFFPRLFSA